MNELEAWEKIEALYEERGVGRPPKSPETCLMFAVLEAGRDCQHGDYPFLKVLKRFHSAIPRDNLVLYNDSHTKEENLALIRQCRSECASEQSGEQHATGEAEKRRDLGVPGPQDTVRDHLGKRRECAASR